MSVVRRVFTIALTLICIAGCADDSPVRATYVPSDCPPCQEAQMAETDTGTQSVEVSSQKPVSTAETESQVMSEKPDEAEEVASEKSEPKPRGERININTARELRLIELPGVGPALAGRIVAYRKKRSFDEPHELKRVRGIGPAKFAKIEPLITVE
jgi:competence ComEA-like helix-hairpin-helix protein